MKKEGDSFLDIFQDPLLTIVAMILMSTLWMIIPGDSRPVDPKPSYIKEDIDSAKRYIHGIEQSIDELRMAIQRLKRELDWLEQQIKETKANIESEKNIIEEIDQRINEIKIRIQRKKEELNRLENQLKEAKEKAVNAKGNVDIKQIKRRIKEMGAEIYKKKEELNRLEDLMKKAEEEKAKASGREKDLPRLILSLQDELKSIIENNRKLEQELEKLEGSTQKQGGGFTTVYESDKKPFYVELINNRLFPVDDEHYDKDFGYLKMEGGKIVGAVQKTRKSSVKGENVKEIESSENIFHKTLEKLKLTEDRVIFMLHGNSFEIFRKARVIALKKGFEIGWWPYEGDSITFVSGGGESIPSIGSTPRP